MNREPFQERRRPLKTSQALRSLLGPGEEVGCTDKGNGTQRTYFSPFSDGVSDQARSERMFFIQSEGSSNPGGSNHVGLLVK